MISQLNTAAFLFPSSSEILRKFLYSNIPALRQHSRQRHTVDSDREPPVLQEDHSRSPDAGGRLPAVFNQNPSERCMCIFLLSKPICLHKTTLPSALLEAILQTGAGRKNPSLLALLNWQTNLSHNTAKMVERRKWQ